MSSANPEGFLNLLYSIRRGRIFAALEGTRVSFSLTEKPDKSIIR